MNTVFHAVIVGIFGLGGLSAAADPLIGKKEIALTQADGTKIVIGEVLFAPGGDQAGYSIEWNESVFTDHFLSMRPFKCIEGGDKHWCHVPYPYQIRRSVSADDLTDLEYDLLFIWKGATDYGINMWNGVYYRLQVEGSGLVGEMYEIDMDTLSVPPPEGELRPVENKDLHESDPDGHWLPGVMIE